MGELCENDLKSDQESANLSAAETPEAKVLRLLRERGLVLHDRLAPPDPIAYRKWKPIVIDGPPLSETIIAERR